MLSACSVTAPVTGQVSDTDETFTGSATGYMDRSGTLEIRSNKGTVCSGNFVYTSAREGEGVFRCADGRTGPFKFVSTGMRGLGHGTIGGKQFTFTFG
jgi:hypothetical protein